MKDHLDPGGNVERTGACKPSVPMKASCANTDRLSGHSPVLLQGLVSLHWDKWISVSCSETILKAEH